MSPERRFCSQAADAAFAAYNPQTWPRLRFVPPGSLCVRCDKALQKLSKPISPPGSKKYTGEEVKIALRSTLRQMHCYMDRVDVPWTDVPWTM